MLRSRRESLHCDGITNQKNLQRTSATKSAHGGHASEPERCLLAGRIVLQKSKVAGLRIFAENPKREAIADSYNLNRATEVACEFNARR
jgi:hypothetical protein